MGSPTSERLPTRQGKVFGEQLQRFWVTQNIPCYVFEDIKIRLGWIGVSLRKKLSPSRMEAVREIQSFAEHQALVLLGTIWMRHPSLCLSGAKLRLKMRPCNNATPDNHCNYRQHAATGFENHCFSEISLLFCSQTLNQWFENMMKQAFAATNKSVTIAASLCIHDAPLTYRLTDSLSYCRMEMMKHCNSSRSP